MASTIDGNKVLRQLKKARSKTPKHSGTISQNGKVLARARGNKPLEAETISEKPLSPKKSFLKQIQNYNDFLVQNDLDAEKINLDHDYDFSAFTSARDWKIESQRLADRLSDRKIEIAQNEDAGEFAGLELENGMPSYEATKNMTDAEFAEYEAKYLTPSLTETLQEPVKPVAAKETVTPAPKRIESAVQGSLDLPKPNAFKTSQDGNESLQKIRKKTKPATSSANWENVIANTFPVSLITQSYHDANDALKSVRKIKAQNDKYGTSTVAEDAGRGIMSGLADTAGSILNIGGLATNPVGNSAKRSAQWWKDSQNIPDSESGRLGSVVGSGAVNGLGGGLLGRGIGTIYKNARYGAENARKRITRLADDRARFIKLHQTKMDEPWTGALSHGSRSTRPSLTENRQKIYENLTQLPPKKSVLNDGIGATLKRSVERSLGEKAMIKRNDDQLSELFTKTGSLKKAGSHQKKNWESRPVQYQKIGSGLGGVVGLGL